MADGDGVADIIHRPIEAAVGTQVAARWPRRSEPAHRFTQEVSAAGPSHVPEPAGATANSAPLGIATGSVERPLGLTIVQLLLRGRHGIRCRRPPGAQHIGRRQCRRHQSSRQRSPRSRRCRTSWAHFQGDLASRCSFSRVQFFAPPKHWGKTVVQL